MGDRFLDCRLRLGFTGCFVCMIKVLGVWHTATRSRIPSMALQPRPNAIRMISSHRSSQQMRFLDHLRLVSANQASRRRWFWTFQQPRRLSRGLHLHHRCQRSKGSKQCTALAWALMDDQTTCMARRRGIGILKARSQLTGQAHFRCLPTIRFGADRRS